MTRAHVTKEYISINTGKVCTNIAQNMPFLRSISHLHRCPDCPFKTGKKPLEYPATLCFPTFPFYFLLLSFESIPKAPSGL